MSTPRLDQKGFIQRDGRLEKIVGSFACDAVPSVNCINPLGSGWTATVVAATAGTYDVTLTDAAYRIVHAEAYMQIITAANIDMYAQVESTTAGATGAASIRIQCMTAAVETDVPVTDRVCFEITVYGNPVDA